jgi:hypothetical protein
VLNEQFMVAAHDPASSGPSAIPLTNKVLKILSAEGHKYKTFGENIILLLNREGMRSRGIMRRAPYMEQSLTRFPTQMRHPSSYSLSSSYTSSSPLEQHMNTSTQTTCGFSLTY